MGDLIEITTSPRENSKFYKIPFGGLRFAVKAESGAGALIGLAKQNDKLECSYWIVLGHNLGSWIKKRKASDAVVERIHNILNENEYRSFWILWDSKSISLGRNGENNPFITYQDSVHQINYATFSVRNGNSTIHWRFEIPPEILTPDLKPLHGGELRWVNIEDQLPHGAVIGGYENETLYIIRAKLFNALLPGKFVPSEGLAYSSWDSRAHETNDFEVLVGYNYVWVPVYKGKIPVNAVIGGYTENTIPEVLFVGRVKQGKHIIPGKVHPSHGVCYVPFEGRECAHRDYEVLVSFDINRRCYNETYLCLDFTKADITEEEDSDDE